MHGEKLINETSIFHFFVQVLSIDYRHVSSSPDIIPVDNKNESELAIVSLYARVSIVKQKMFPTNVYMYLAFRVLPKTC